MNLDIEKSTYEEIAKVIHSDSSPVGIDAKKTHILILKMLSDINERLSIIENEIKKSRTWTPLLKRNDLKSCIYMNKNGYFNGDKINTGID